MLNFKSFHSARNVFADIERTPMLRKGQMVDEKEMPFVKQYYALAG
jgi:hypothetical protein